MKPEDPLSPLMAVIPARGGSKGIPGKNLRPFVGRPLIAQTIRFAQGCPGIHRTVVSTDSPHIAEVARAHGGDVPFLRPAELARDESPMWPVVRHALDEVERQEGRTMGGVLLLDPTSPGRLHEDILGARAKLEADPNADGVVGVSEPDFNPIWHGVTEREGWMEDLYREAKTFERRQDVPTVYRINASLYLFRRAFVKREVQSWRRGRLKVFVIPESRSIHIDTLDQFERAEALVRAGLIRLPWLEGEVVRR